VGHEPELAELELRGSCDIHICSQQTANNQAAKQQGKQRVFKPRLCGKGFFQRQMHNEQDMLPIALYTQRMRCNSPGASDCKGNQASSRLSRPYHIEKR
jgi:hypothetical protein